MSTSRVPSLGLLFLRFSCLVPRCRGCGRRGQVGFGPQNLHFAASGEPNSGGQAHPRLVHPPEFLKWKGKDEPKRPGNRQEEIKSLQDWSKSMDKKLVKV